MTLTLWHRIDRALRTTTTVHASCAVSFALGLFFIFVWSPLPWGWEGIDHYHSRAIRLAEGASFDTTDVPWGYAYFVAAFYRVFGPHAWIPLVAQAALNATIPLALYSLARPLAGPRAAALGAILASVLSFNTVYAGTQSSDSVSTVLFLWALLCFGRGVQGGSIWQFAAAGTLAGVAAQFRPNLILFPLVAAGLLVVARRFHKRSLTHAAVYLAMVAVTLTPWVVRNHRLTGQFMPTSTHGGVQLWYGTLQVGPYLESRARNPRSAFESAAFDYTSVEGQPLLIATDAGPCQPSGTETFSLIYWSDREPQPSRVAAQPPMGGVRMFQVPGQQAPTTLYYYFEATRPTSGGEPEATFHVPAAGADDPLVAFVSLDHLTDMDRHNDILNIFDVVALVQHLAWQAPVSDVSRLDLNRDDRLDEADLDLAVAALVPEAVRMTGSTSVVRLVTSADTADVRLPDESVVSVPRTFGGRQSDILPVGGMATDLVSRWRTYTSLLHGARLPSAGGCRFLEKVDLNGVFYRREVHMANRYMALAFDNIGRDPRGFARSSVYRMVRLFIIRGTSDPMTTQQFARSRLSYGAGFALSAAYFTIFVAGAVIALRQRSPLLWLLVPIAYLPATISFVLTNMRYTITVQPLMFVFVAVAVVTALGLDSGSNRARATTEAPLPRRRQRLR